MAMMRRNPERGIVPLRSAFDRLLEEAVMPTFSGWMGGEMMPALDVRETDDAYLVEAELPGVRPDDVDVTLEGRTLTIRGQFGEGRQEERETYILRERRSGSFVRTLGLPMEVDVDNISSSFENGELRLELPKAASSRARRIEITPSGRDARRVGGGEGQGGPG